MPNHLSLLGIVHTVISIFAVIAGFVALYRDGQIKPGNAVGKTYIILTILTCLTSFGVMKTGHLTPAHGLSVLILILLPIGIYAPKWFGQRGIKAQVIVMTVTLMLSLVPAITETLTRLPVTHPVADGPDASIIKFSNLVLLIVFVTGIFFQLRRLRRPQPAGNVTA